MKVDDALKAMGCIEGQRNGTLMRDAVVDGFHERLMTNPETFWDCYFESLSLEQPETLHLLAQQLFSIGAVTDLTTFADLPAILQRLAA